MQYRPDTNCISLTRDANVALTYHSNNKKYILVKIKPEDLESEKVIDAGKYVYDEIKKTIESAILALPKDSEIKKKIEQIEMANSISDIITELKDTDLPITSSIVGDRQYLTEEGQLQMSKVLAELKYLESKNVVGNIIPEVENINLLMMMGNAYTSSEYIHYGDILEEDFFECPLFFIEAFSLIEQARVKGVAEGDVTRIREKLLELVKDGFQIDEKNNLLTNGREQIEIRPEIIHFLTENYSERNKIESQLTINKAFELTQGEYTYQETKIQLAAIQLLSETILNRRAIVEILKQALPGEEVEKVFDDTICIHPEMAKKQNGRGYKVSDSVNILIAGLGYELTKEQTKTLLESINSLSSEELISICEQGIEKDGIQDLLVHTKEKEKRIRSHVTKTVDIQYMAEAIIEGYDWRKRPLAKKEKDTLAQKIILGIQDVDGLNRLYQALGQMTFGKRKFKQDEIFAIIMNIAIDGKLGDYSYRDLLNQDEEIINKLLQENVEGLQTTVSPVQIDLLMKRGKVINKLKEELIQLGIEKSFIEEKDIRNIYTAKRIVEEYDFGRELTKEEKRVLIQSILNVSYLNKRKGYLTILIQKLSEIGLNEQEVYGSVINMAVTGSAVKEDGFYYTGLLNSYSKVEELKDKIEKIETQVTEITIQKAIVDNLNFEDIEKLKERLQNLGIPEQIIENRREENLFMAEQIVEGYNFERKISEEEKRALIQSILKNSLLTKEVTYYLASLTQCLSEIGLSKQEVYGSIINMAVKGSAIKSNATRYDYTSLLSAPSKIEELEGRIGEIETKVTEVTIQKSIIDNINSEDVDKLKNSLKELGIPEEMVESKNEENLFVAHQIVEEYNFGRQISEEEKRALIQSILKKSQLDKRYHIYLITLIQNLEKIGLSKQEIYGSVINMATKGSAVKEVGYDYSELLGIPSKVENLNGKKEKIETKVTELTIQNAIADNLNSEDIDKLKNKLKDLGISKDVIENKREDNLFMAEQIVEKYNFGRQITVEEKGALMQLILKNACLDKTNSRCLTTLVQNLSEAGLSNQEIYGSIINMAVDDSKLKKEGYSYTIIIKSPFKCKELINKNVEMQTEVTEETIKKATVEMTSQKTTIDELTPEEISKLKNRLKDLGIPEEVIENKKEENLAMAERIVEEYNFGRQISEEEKRALIQVILRIPKFNKGIHCQYLTTLVQYFSKIGLSNQEIYGSIINMAVTGSAVKENGYSYSRLLNSTYKVEELKGKTEIIETKVSEETIEKAQKVAKKIMKEAVAKAKENGSLSNIESTRKALKTLQELENSISIEED